VVEAARRVTGRDFKVVMGTRRAGDPPALVGSNEMAKSVLGWAPERGDMETILQDAWRWHLKRFG